MKKIDFEEAIKALKEGKKVFEDTWETWKDEEGIIVQKNAQTGSNSYNVTLHDNGNYYLPEEPKPFEITETGLYKTRSGRLAFVYYIYKKAHPNHTCYYVVVGDPEDCHCHSNGLYKQGGEQGYDIIGKWEEE